MQRIIKSVFDRVIATIAIIILSPLFIIAAIGVKLSSPGPVFYRARRMGKDMKPIYIYKFRSMHVGSDSAGAITGTHDSRIFPWGNFLRKTKIDELPQLINIIIGNMSIIGPRPEDVDIVNKYYTKLELQTLCVLPGLACPGSIFNYTHGDLFLSDEASDDIYINKFMHIKLALDIYYLNHWSLWYDFKIIFRTLYAIIKTATSPSKHMPPPSEYKAVFKTDLMSI